MKYTATLSSLSDARHKATKYIHWCRLCTGQDCGRGRIKDPVHAPAVGRDGTGNTGAHHDNTNQRAQQQLVSGDTGCPVQTRALKAGAGLQSHHQDAFILIDCRNAGCVNEALSNHSRGVPTQLDCESLRPGSLTLLHPLEVRASGKREELPGRCAVHREQTARVRPRPQSLGGSTEHAINTMTTSAPAALKRNAERLQRGLASASLYSTKCGNQSGCRQRSRSETAKASS